MLCLKSIKHRPGQLASPNLVIISITIAFFATRFGYAGMNLYKLNAVGKPLQRKAQCLMSVDLNKKKQLAHFLVKDVESTERNGRTDEDCCPDEHQCFS